MHDSHVAALQCRPPLGTLSDYSRTEGIAANMIFLHVLPVPALLQTSVADPLPESAGGIRQIAIGTPHTSGKCLMRRSRMAEALAT